MPANSVEDEVDPQGHPSEEPGLDTTPTATAETIEVNSASNIVQQPAWVAQVLDAQANYVEKLEQQLPEVTSLLPNPNLVPCRKSRKIDAPHAPLSQRVKRDVSFLAVPDVDLGLPAQLKEVASQAEVPAEYHQGEFFELLRKYKNIFCEDSDPTPCCPLFEQEIKLDTNVPICQRQYPLPRAAMEALKGRVEEFLKAGVIKPSTSPYNSLIWPVEKPDGSYRVCIDFRKINEHILPDPFPLPKIDEILEKFHGMQYFSSLDLYWGFYQVKVKPEDTHKLAFTTSEGRFEFVTLPMGVKNLPFSLSETYEYGVFRPIKQIAAYIHG
jgi:hypothetical protein